jgi:hypothetical protein
MKNCSSRIRSNGRQRGDSAFFGFRGFRLRGGLPGLGRGFRSGFRAPGGFRFDFRGSAHFDILYYFKCFRRIYRLAGITLSKEEINMTEKEKNLMETFLKAIEGEGFVTSLEIEEGPNYALAKRDFLTRIKITLSKRIENIKSCKSMRKTAVSFVSDLLDILDKQESGE